MKVSMLYYIDPKIKEVIELSKTNNALEITKRIFRDKYSHWLDVDNLDFKNLLQDEFCIDNIIGYTRHPTRNKMYFKLCDICSKNIEMNGLGIYLFSKKDIKSGVKCCNCSKSTKYTHYQNIIRFNKIALLNNLELLNYNHSSKIITYICNKNNHKIVQSSKVDYFLVLKHFCKKCIFENKSKTHSVDDEIHIKEFMSTGNFLEGTKFWRSDRRTTSGLLNFWYYECPKCSYDEYVQNGLCDGKFEVNIGNLKLGNRACRCESRYRWTQDQREYQLNKNLSSRNITQKFLYWDNGFYENAFSYAWVECSIPEHENYKSTCDNLLRGRGCGQCRGHSQRQCYINLVLDNDIPIALKYGIAVEHESRVQNQCKKSIYDIKNYGVWEFYGVYSCKSAESECKRTFTRVLEKREMQDGFTETTEVLNLNKIIEIYENWGGIRIK